METVTVSLSLFPVAHSTMPCNTLALSLLSSCQVGKRNPWIIDSACQVLYQEYKDDRGSRRLREFHSRREKNEHTSDMLLYICKQGHLEKKEAIFNDRKGKSVVMISRFFLQQVTKLRKFLLVKYAQGVRLFLV